MNVPFRGSGLFEGPGRKKKAVAALVASVALIGLGFLLSYIGGGTQKGSSGSPPCTPSGRHCATSTSATVPTTTAVTSTTTSTSVPTTTASTSTATTTTPTTTTTPLPGGDEFGVAVGYPSAILIPPGSTYSNYMQHIASIGATVVRTDYGAGSGTTFQSAYNAAIAAGLQVVPILIFHCSDTIASAQAKALDLASRYVVTQVELGNEPNGSWSWCSGVAPNPEGYTALACAAAAVLRTNLPGVTLISPGLAEYVTTDGTHMNAVDFQNREIAAGMNACADEWGYHPYSDGAWANQLQAMHQALLNAGINEPMVISETGRNTLTNTEAQEATAVTDRIAYVRNASWISAMFWYDGQDHCTTCSTTIEDRFGLFRTDWSPKPAATAFATAVR